MDTKVYIDGENFRHIFSQVLVAAGIYKDSKDITNFPVRKLLESTLDMQKFSICYYASKIKLPRGHKISDKIFQQTEQIKEFNRRWVPSLLNQDINYIKAGYLKVKDGAACPNCGRRHDITRKRGRC